MTLLGLDIGTTHCKAGLFDPEGRALRIASRPMAVHRALDGTQSFDPGELWVSAAAVIAEAVADAPDPVRAIGIASMAETGLLVDRASGLPRSAVIPWFDRSAQPQAEALARHADPLALFITYGLQPSYKCSFAKLLWLQAQGADLAGATWLGASEYVVLRLTGACGTDYSLAGRTCAFDIANKRWDADALAARQLPPDIFPPAALAGTPLGTVQPEWAALGLPPGVPVAIGGHDHVCGALAVGAVTPGRVFDSMGTAEALLGAFPERPLTADDYRSGLMTGCHVLPGHMYWMGGLSTSGGALEWLRAQLSPEPLSYEDLLALLESAPPEPTGILFFPYLLGSDSPHRDPALRAAWIGLRRHHTRADLARAVVEGVAYELELGRRAGEQITGQPIERLAVAGGGTRNPTWMQVKADISGCHLDLAPQPETTLLGAALLAGSGAGVFGSVEEALAPLTRQAATAIAPDAARHQLYTELFEQGYRPLLGPLRDFGRMPLFHRHQEQP
jgi:sugar (pentulose or hexulose) kinase